MGALNDRQSGRELLREEQQLRAALLVGAVLAHYAATQHIGGR